MYSLIHPHTHIVFDGSSCVMTQTMLTNADVPVGVNFTFNACLHQNIELHIRNPTMFLNRNERQWGRLYCKLPRLPEPHRSCAVNRKMGMRKPLMQSDCNYNTRIMYYRACAIPILELKK